MDSRLRRCLGGFRENCIFIYSARNSVAEKLFILFIHARYALGVHGGGNLRTQPLWVMEHLLDELGRRNGEHDYSSIFYSERVRLRFGVHHSTVHCRRQWIRS